MPTNNDENAVELNIFCAIANMLKDAKLEDATASDLEKDYLTAWKEIQAIYIATSNETFYEKGPVVGEKDQGTGKGKNHGIGPKLGKHNTKRAHKPQSGWPKGQRS